MCVAIKNYKNWQKMLQLCVIVLFLRSILLLAVAAAAAAAD